MDMDPRPGLVLRYDFLWKEDRDAGREDGTKDRPCAVVLVSVALADDSRKVLLCPITHSPVSPGETGLPIPPAVARHLGLDDRPSWIKTHQVNVITWQNGRIPAGIVPARPGVWAFGQLPDSLGRAMFAQVLENSRKRSLGQVARTP